MKTKITILFCILIAKCFSQTPTYDWVNSNSKISTYSTTCDINGNVYCSAVAIGNISMGGTSLSTYDWFIMKITSTNQISWVKKIGNIDFSMATTFYINDHKNIVADSLGNIFCSGFFFNSLVLDGFNISVDSANYTGQCLIKLDSLSNTVWIKKITSPDNQALAPRLQLVSNNKIILYNRYLVNQYFDNGISITNNNPEKQGVFIAFYNADGTLEDVKQLEPIVEPYPFAFGYDEEAVVINEEGDILRAFSATATEFSIDGTNYEADSVFYYLYGADTIFYDVPFAITPNYGLIKYDANLNVLWQKVIKAGASSFSLCSDGSGGLDFSGVFGRDFIIIDGDTLVNSNLGGQGFADAYLCRFDQNGEKNWHVKTFNTANESINDIRIDLVGNLYFNVFEGFITYVGYLKKLSPQGNEIWQKEISTFNSRYFVSNCVDFVGNVFSSGNIDAYDVSTIANFDSIEVIIPVFSPQGFVAKLGNCNPDTPIISTGSAEICANQNIILSCENADSYLWSNGDTSQSITVNTAGSYSVFAIDSLGCFAKSLDQEIVVIPLPSVTVTTNQNTLTASLSSAEYQWIDCNNDNQIIEGATNQNFSTDSNGSYAVIVSASGCTDTSECYAINMSGLNENLESNLFQIYPNPVNNIIQLKINKDQELNIQKVVIKNVLGQIIFSQNKIVSTIDVSNFSNGIYNLEVFLEKGIWKGQFVKE